MNVRILGETIPPAFWAEIKRDGLIDPEAPTPE